MQMHDCGAGVRTVEGWLYIGFRVAAAAFRLLPIGTDHQEGRTPQLVRRRLAPSGPSSHQCLNHDRTCKAV